MSSVPSPATDLNWQNQFKQKYKTPRDLVLDPNFHGIEDLEVRRDLLKTIYPDFEKIDKESQDLTLQQNYKYWQKYYADKDAAAKPKEPGILEKIAGTIKGVFAPSLPPPPSGMGEKAAQPKKKEAEIVRPRTKLQPEQEKEFQKWYSQWAQKAGIDPDPDNLLHKYDYRGAFKAKQQPILAEDGLFHWPSRWKDEDHPNRFVNGVDTKKEDTPGLQTPPMEKVAIDLPAEIERAKAFQLPPELKKLTPEQRSKIIKEREQKVISAFKPQKIEEAKVELPTPGQLPTAPALPTEITSEEEIKETALQQARQPIPEITIINGVPYRKLMSVKKPEPELKPGQMAKLNLQRMQEDKIPIPKDRMANAVNSFFQGIADQVPMAMKTIGSIPHLIDASTQQMENIGRMEQGLEPEGMPKLENSTLFKMANEVQRKIENSLPVNPKFQEEYWASMIPQGLGSTIGFIAMGMVGGEAGLPAAATTMAAGALVQAGSTYEEAYNAGANPTQLFAAFIAGVGLGSTEALPIERGLSRLDKISGGWATRWIKDRMARGMLSGSAKGYLEEFGQEWMQNIGQDWVVSSLTGEPMNMKENNRQGIAGGVSGAAFSAFTSAIGVSRARSYIRGTVQQRRLNYAKNLQEANLPPDVINNLLKATERAENKVIRELENEIDAAESKAKAKVEEFEKLTGSKAVMVMRTRDPRVDSLGRQLFEMIKRRDTAQANGDEPGFAYAADEVKKIQAEIDSIPEAGGVIAIRNVAEAKKAEKDLETAEEKPKAPAETLPTPPPPAAEAAPVVPPAEAPSVTPPVETLTPEAPTAPTEELPIGRTDADRRGIAREDESDRRQDWKRRKQVSQMTREEIEKELLTDELTQLRNRSAWERAPFKKYVASLDLDKMKKINDVYGQDEGDRYLQHAAQGFMQSGISVYRLGGDDFVTKADTKEEIDAAMTKAQKWFDENPFTVGDNQMKVGFSYGVEESPEAAFKTMKGKKAAAEAEGKLEPRYEKPESLPPVPETIPPVPETTEETVPERPSTILSQIETIGSGNRQVVFVPESTLQDWQRRDLINDFLSMVAEIPQLNNVDIPGKGTFFYHPNMLTEDDILLAVEQGQEHKLMGILDPKSAATSIGLRAEKWNPDTNAWEEFMTVVSKPEHLRVQLELLKKQVEGKGKFRFLTGPAEDIAKETIDGRKGEALTPPPKTIEPQEAEIPAPPEVIEPTPEATVPEFKATLYQGKGASPAEIYGQAAVDEGRAVPLFGTGDYYAFKQEDAAHFGEVTQHEVILQNPFILDSDEIWFQLLKDAGTPHLNNMSELYYKEPQMIAPETKKLQDFLVSQGYDGIIATLDPYSDNTRRLSAMIGTSQVVKFPTQQGNIREAELPTPPAVPPTILDIIPEPPAEKEPAQPEEITRDQRFRDLLAKIKAALVNREKFNNPMLQAMANEAFGGARGQGKYTLRDMYDVFEGAVSEYIEESGIVDFNDPVATMDRLEELQGRLAVQSDRTTEQIELQQFSTPPMQAFLTAYALGNPSSPLTALEPSAGTGMLATMMRIRGYQVRANEIDERRVTVLKLRGFPTSTVDALHLTTTGTSLSDYTPDVILMNPPFSAGPGKLHGMEFGARHVMNALQKLAPGGRLVAIVGEGMGHHRSKFNKWWNQVQAHYNVRADLGLKGQYYQKMGTTYDNRMIVIDKTGPTPGDTGAERSSKVLIAHQLSPAEALEKLSVIAGEDIYGRITRPSPIESIKAPPPIEGPVIGPAEPTTGTGGGSPGVTGGRPGVPSGDESRPGELGHVPESGERGPGGSLPGPPPIDIERKPTDAGKPETTPGLGGRPGAPTSGGPGDMAPIEVALDAQDKALGEEETDAYVKYKPKKAVYKGSKPHPAELIESATLGSVESPDIKVKINLPPDVISTGRLSDAQLETITYAVQRFGTTLPNGDTAGFWIGDGTGVGKGREIAGIIYHYLRETGQKKAVWISATQQLYEDAKRDIGGVGVPLSVIHQNESKFAKGAPIDSTEGILFTQYGTAASNWKSKRERFNQIIDWLQPAEAKEFDGVIVFDECFTYETLIKTDRGEIPIGEIVEKQLAVKVLSYNKECSRYEWKPVLRWLPRTINSSLVKITHEYGSFTCTPNHKIWNQKDRKYVLAGELSPGMFLLWQPENKKARQENQPPSFLQHELSKELLCTDESSADLRLVRDPVSTQCERIEAKATSKILQYDMLSKMADEPTGIPISSINGFEREAQFYQGKENAGTLRTDEDKKSYVQSRQYRENATIPQSERMELFISGRKRETDRAAENVVQKDEYPYGICNPNISSQGEIQESSNPLQGGFSYPSPEDCNRSGREFPQNQKMEVSRSQENGDFGISRVVSIEILESGDIDRLQSRSAQDRIVYDLEVADNHNYFADGILVSNCHAMKNAVGTNQGGASTTATGTDRGEMGLLLARQFPKAKILYVSATGATLAHNMGYMNRLGLWGEGTAFADFDAFMNAMNTGGLGAMEMLSRDLKSLGAFISRQISYRGVNYDYVNHELNEYQLEQYNKSASMWSKLIKQMEIAEGNANQKRGGTRYSQFYSTQQRFFLMLMTTYQMQSVLTHLDESLKNGMAPIINILSTNETLMKKEVAKAEAAGKSIEDIDIGPRQMIKSYIENWFPLEEMEDVPDPDNPQSTIQIATGEINQENLRMQEELLNELEYLNLPDNPMDMIANHLGGWGKVAEVSGRTERIEGNKLVRRKPAGKKPGETINNAELRRFQNGEADVLIITGAGSAGISAQAEKGIPTANKRRIMYCAQLSWSADQQMQFFGRAHRSNQVTPPIIMLVKTNVAGQQRLINAVSRRLASLGAVTQGNRESLGGSLFDIEDLTDGYGRTALMSLVHDLAHNNYEVKGDYGSGVDVLDAMGWLTPNKSLKPGVDTNVEGFLNRIMVLPVDVQNDVFNNFYGRYQDYLAVAKEQGTFDTGISKIRGSNIVITKEEVIYKDPNTHMETKFLEMEGDFKTEKLKWGNIPRSADLIGFVTNKRSGKISAAYNYVDPLTGNRKIDLRTVRFTKNRIEIKEFNENYEIIKGTPSDKAATPERLPGPPITALEQAKDLWEKEFAEIPETTRRPVYMVTGAVFPIHDKIIGAGQLHNLRIVRAVLADGSPVIGIQVRTNEIGPLKSRLGMGNDFTKESGLAIFTMVRDGATIELDNNWRIQMTPPIHGERRMEINLARAYREAAVKTLKDQGAITEIIVGGESRRPRVFVPLDDVEGPKLLDKIFERNKPVRVIPTGPPSAPGGGGPTSAMSIGLNVEADGSRSMEVGRGDVPQSIEQARQAAEFWLKQAQESIDRILNGQGTLDDQMIVHQNPVIAKHLLNWIKTQDNTHWLNERIYVDKVGQEVSDHVSSEVDFDNTQAQAEAIHYFPYVEEMMDDLKRIQEGEEMPQTEEEPTSAMASSPGAPVLPAPPQTSGAPNYAPPPVINKKDLVRRNDILTNLAKKLKVPIRYGRFRQRALGIFKISASAIRIKKAQDVAVAAHEVGHAINKILWGMSGKQLSWRPLAPHRVELEAIATKAYAGQSKLPEGFAEYIRYWITDPAQAAQLCPGVNLMFEGELARNPDLAGILKEAQRDYKRWLDQTSSAKILSHISVEEPVYDQMGWFEKIYTGMVNHLNPINEAVKIITKGRKILMEDDPGKLAQALGGWAARAEHFLQVGTFGKNLDTLLGPGLKQILEPMEDRLDDLRITAIALRTLEKKGLQGIEVGITVQEAKESLQEQGFDLRTLTVGSTPAMLGHPSVPAFDVNSLKAATPAAQITKDTLLKLYKYQDQLLVYFRDCGMLSVDQYISIKLLNQFFVPFHRMYEAGAGEKTTESRAKAGSSLADLWQPVKKMKGSWRPIIDPLESIIKNTYTLINVAERNLVGQALANLAKEDGAGRWISGPLAAKVVPETFALDRIKNALSAAGVDLSDPNLNLDQLATIFVPNAIPSPKENIITVYFKGKPILYQLEPNLYKAIKGLDKDSIGILMKIAAIPASVLRMGATGINPEFASRNIARDMLTAWAQTDIGYIPGYHTLQGLGHVIMKDKDYQEWMRSGGPHSAMASMDRKEMSMALRDLMSGKMEYALRHPIDALRILSEISEAMTRVSIYTQTRKRGGSIREAGLASREGTLDFQRIGAWARGFNLTIPFFNASIQDVDKFVRVHKFNPKKAVLKGAIFQAISVLVYYLNKDDERYREAPWWLRDLFWLFPTKGIPGLSQATPWIPVPKPFSWGMFYATPAERLAEYIDTHDPTAFDSFIKNLISNITPGIVPTIAKTPFELVYNKNFFTNREIESDWMQKNYLPEYRSNWYTSEFANQTALLMAKMGIHVSPVKIEHAMFSTFGGSARLATKVLLDPATKLISPPKGRTLPTAQLADVPLIRSIAVRFPHASLRSISKVYDLWEDINLKYRSRKQSRKEGNRFDLPPFTPQERKMYGELRYATERFKSINREIHRVIQDPEYSADEKRRRIDNAYMRMLATAQKSLKKLGVRKYKEETIGLQSPPDDTSGSLPEPPED